MTAEEGLREQRKDSKKYVLKEEGEVGQERNTSSQQRKSALGPRSVDHTIMVLFYQGDECNIFLVVN
jgi:hypothetical protein